MSSLACFLKDLGYYVIGSDTEDEYFTSEILRKRKIETLIFNKNNITSDFVYIIGHAYNEENEEVSKIILNDFEHYYYNEFIGQIIDKNIIAISGTHGKTTTAAFLSQMFNKEASYIIGDGTGYGTNETNLLVLEACEYKEHFLKYSPFVTLITNIDYDHPDYFINISDTISSFQKLANKSKLLIINNDDENTRKIKHNNKYTFGFNNDSNYKISIEEQNHLGYKIMLLDKINKHQYHFNIGFLGKHYIYDFVGAVVCMLVLNKMPYLENLTLPLRRLTEYKYGKSILVDDYAHHPKEIKCLFETIKMKYPDFKKNVIFQSHTYSRTTRFIEEFKEALLMFDDVYIEETFTSKREKINKELENKIEVLFSCFNKFDNTTLNKINYNKKEVWIFLGAGIVNKYIFDILENNKV